MSSAAVQQTLSGASTLFNATLLGTLQTTGPASKVIYLDIQLALKAITANPAQYGVCGAQHGYGV